MHNFLSLRRFAYVAGAQSCMTSHSPKKEEECHVYKITLTTKTNSNGFSSFNSLAVHIRQAHRRVYIQFFITFHVAYAYGSRHLIVNWTTFLLGMSNVYVCVCVARKTNKGSSSLNYELFEFVDSFLSLCSFVVFKIDSWQRQRRRHQVCSSSKNTKQNSYFSNKVNIGRNSNPVCY